MAWLPGAISQGWSGRSAAHSKQSPLPSLSKPCVYGAAATIGDMVYLTGGQTGPDLSDASGDFLRLDMSAYDGTPQSVAWERLPSWPGPARAFPGSDRSRSGRH